MNLHVAYPFFSKVAFHINVVYVHIGALRFLSYILRKN